VIRSSEQGNSHGGVYLVNLAKNSFQQVVDWNDQSISWEGRGWDRGLRGIAFYDEHIYLAASDELFVYDQDFTIVKSFTNPYLKHCHEISIYQQRLYLTSTGFDAILEFDLTKEQFTRAWQAVSINGQITDLRPFDPLLATGPSASMDCHINNIGFWQNKMHLSGTKLNSLALFNGREVMQWGGIPLTSHNAQVFGNGTLCNDTGSDQVAVFNRQGQLQEAFTITKYPQNELDWTHLTEDRARQGFARGLALYGNDKLIAGSSPSTISVYQFGGHEPVCIMQLTNDIRNSIHGLEVWPY
jgi:hypothetical protein